MSWQGECSKSVGVLLMAGAAKNQQIVVTPGANKWKAVLPARKQKRWAGASCSVVSFKLLLQKRQINRKLGFSGQIFQKKEPNTRQVPPENWWLGKKSPALPYWRTFRMLANFTYLGGQP
jgi:hypothetical protein